MTRAKTKVFIVGATGETGRSIVDGLLAAKEYVRPASSPAARCFELEVPTPNTPGTDG